MVAMRRESDVVKKYHEIRRKLLATMAESPNSQRLRVVQFLDSKLIALAVVNGGEEVDFFKRILPETKELFRQTAAYLAGTPYAFWVEDNDRYKEFRGALHDHKRCAETGRAFKEAFAAA